MKYNIDIFKTPSYQKIFKEVLKLRHPNLSEEEALKEEVKNFGCLLLVDYRKEQDAVAQTRCFEKRYSLLHFYHFEEGGDLYQKGSLNLYHFAEVKHRILGRPITISELVDVLNRENEVWYYAGGSIVMMDSFKKENGGWELQECMRLVGGELKNINFLHELEEETLNDIVEQLD